MLPPVPHIALGSKAIFSKNECQTFLACSKLHQQELNPYEVRAIDAIDHLFMQHQAKAAKKQSKK